MAGERDVRFVSRGMLGVSDNVLAFLREQFGRVNTKLDRLGDDVHDLKLRMTGVEEGLAGVNRRLDRLEQRVDQIERRLDLTESSA